MDKLKNYDPLTLAYLDKGKAANSYAIEAKALELCEACTWAEQG